MKDICCYILHSASLGKFYTGACQDSLEERVYKHNKYDYGNHRFSAVSNDWELFLRIDVADYPHAIRLERKIKSMKSTKYIQNLKSYPELVVKITEETR